MEKGYEPTYLAETTVTSLLENQKAERSYLTSIFFKLLNCYICARFRILVKVVLTEC